MKTPDISALFNLKRGERILIEVEKLAQDDNTCVSAAITAKDPRRNKVLEDYFKIRSISPANVAEVDVIHGPDNDILCVADTCQNCKEA